MQYYAGSQKIVLLGNPGVGKTSIVQRYIHKRFQDHNEPTIGAAYTTSTITKDNCQLTLEIWDTAGQERYRSLVSMYLRNVSGILLVYDLSDTDASMSRWIGYIDRNMSDEAKRDLKLYIVGNKSDTPSPDIHLSSLNAMLDEMSYNYIHFKVSARTGDNIDDLFNRISDDMIEITKKNRYIVSKDSGVIKYIDTISPDENKWWLCSYL